MNAPVGPPICTLLPPNSEIRKPPTIAVTMPCAGAVPEAMAMAMESGKRHHGHDQPGDHVCDELLA